MKTTSPRIFASAIALIGITTASAQTTINFNGGVATDWTNQFTQTSTNNYTWSSSSGTGGGGAFTTSGNANTTYNTGFSTSGVTSFKISALLKGTGTATGESANQAHLGFGTASTSSLTQNSSTDVFGVRVNSTVNTGELEWQFRTITSANVTNNTAYISPVITNGSGATYSGSNWTASNPTNWFLLEATYAKTVTAGVWSFSASMQDYGANGTVAGAVLSSISGTFSQAGTYSADTLFGTANWRNSFGSLRFSAMDDFTVSAIPEPSTYAAWAGFCMLGLAVLRRKRR
jgi:hypothetical protein